MAGNIVSSSLSLNQTVLNQMSPYKLSFSPVNYVQNMSIVIGVPSQITMAVSGTYQCVGIQGFDNPSFPCLFDKVASTVTISGQITSTTIPQNISFIINNLTSPTSFGTTQSFSIQTFVVAPNMTQYPIEFTSTGLAVTINCISKCLTCTSDSQKC